MSMPEFVLETTREQPVLTIRTRAAMEELPAVLGKAFMEMGQYLGELGEEPVDAPYCAYYNMDMQDLDLEIGFPVAGILPDRGAMRYGAIPAGRRVMCLYRGPYTEMGPVYEAMTAWMGEQGLIPSGVVYEHYFNSPAEVPEDQLLTRIVFPLRD